MKSKSLLLKHMLSFYGRLFVCGFWLIASQAVPASLQAENVTSSQVLSKCWSPQELQYNPSEKIVRKGIKEAIVKAPDITHLQAEEIPPHLQGSIRRVTLPAGKKLIALTLDLCETPWEVAGYDGAVIEYLRKNNIKATLFTGGKWLLSHKERTSQLLADPLFEIANHGWTHLNLRTSPNQTIQNEILSAQAAYELSRQKLSEKNCLAPQDLDSRIPAKMTLFRFPFGACKPESLKAAANSGLLSIQWDVSTGDPSPLQTPEGIAREVLRNTKPGSIIIAHANGRGWHTSEALPLFIPKLKAQGYEFVTVSELLKAGTPVITQECYDHKLGDTNRYDMAVRKKRTNPKTEELHQ